VLVSDIGTKQSLERHFIYKTNRRLYTILKITTFLRESVKNKEKNCQTHYVQNGLGKNVHSKLNTIYKIKYKLFIHAGNIYIMLCVGIRNLKSGGYTQGSPMTSSLTQTLTGHRLVVFYIISIISIRHFATRIIMET
jgi:hypothetical protein